MDRLRHEAAADDAERRPPHRIVAQRPHCERDRLASLAPLANRSRARDITIGEEGAGGMMTAIDGRVAIDDGRCVVYTCGSSRDIIDACPTRYR